MKENGLKRHYFVLASTWIGAFVVCVTAIYLAYGLHGTVSLYKNHWEQMLAIMRTAFIATFVSLCVVWFSVRRRCEPGIAALWVGTGVLIGLALYGIAGCGGVLGDDITIGRWKGSTGFFFPSLLFSEFNFLTFIFEVAPITALGASLAAYFSLRCTMPKEIC